MDSNAVSLLLLFCITVAVTQKVKIRTGDGHSSYDAELESILTGVIDHTHVAKVYRLTGNLSNLSATKHSVKIEFEHAKTAETIPGNKDWDGASVTISTYTVVRDVAVKRKDFPEDFFNRGYVEFILNMTGQKLTEPKARLREGESTTKEPEPGNSLNASVHLSQLTNEV